MSARALLTMLLLPVLLLPVMAQQDGYPADAEPGKCYAREYVPPEYEFREVTEVDQPAKTKQVKVPAKYKMVYDTTVLRPAQKKLIPVPAEYEMVVETVMVAPPSTKWVKQNPDPNCFSPNPEDCQVVALVDVPAKYSTFKRKVLKTPAYTKEINIPREIKISERKVLVEPAKTVEEEIPATYRTVMKRFVKTPGKYTDWIEVVCNKFINWKFVHALQKGLIEEGYDPGVADGILGARTTAALLQYQEDNNLPLGSLNMQTMNKLGLDPENLQ